MEPDVILKNFNSTFATHIEQIKICISTNENENGEKSAEGKEVFLHNSFPDQKIKAPSPEFETVHQPNSIEEIREALSHIKNLMTELESKIEKSLSKEKQNIRV